MPRVVQLIDRHRWWLLSVFALAIGATLVAHARAKAFWHDEIFTILLSRLPLVSIWRASREGVDLAPPLAAVLTKIVHALGDSPVVTRSPQMLGFAIACALIFTMARRRSNVVVAFSAAMLLCVTPAFDHALEVRGYGLTLGLCALALYTWSEAAQGRQRLRNLSLLAVALAAGVWAHYYAALVFLPIAIGEVVRQVRARAFDRGPWLALVAAGLCVLPLVPLVLANAPQAAHFWTRSKPVPIRFVYQYLLGTLPLRGVAFAIGLLGLFALVEAGRRLRGGRPSSRRFEPHEVAAALTWLMLPAVALLMGTMAGGLLTTRYVTFAAVGIALIAPLVAWRFTGEHAIGDAVVCLMLAASVVIYTGRSVPGHGGLFHDPDGDRSALTAAISRGPVVITGGTSYLQLWFYVPPDRQADAIYVADPEAELRRTRTDTIDRGYLALSRWTPLPVVEASAFLSTHDSFQLYTLGLDWLTPQLRAAGATFEEIGRDSDAQLYLVHQKR